MNAKQVINELRNQLDLTEAEASERAYAILAEIRGRHPRIKITAVVIESQVVVIRLKNGTQVRFDPDVSVPIWRYNSRARKLRPGSGKSFPRRMLSRLSDLQCDLMEPMSSAHEELVRTRISQMLILMNADSADELFARLRAAVEAEEGEERPGVLTEYPLSRRALKHFGPDEPLHRVVGGKIQRVSETDENVH